MEEKPSVFSKEWHIPFLDGAESYIRSRPASDQFIFLILGLLVAGTSVLGFVELQGRIMVTEPAYGGSLTEGDIGAPRFVNPLLALSDTDQDLTALTYAGLMGEAPDGSLVPVLAQSYIVSPDGRTYQFTLRNNLKFSDGTPITADDVVFTVQKAQDAALKSPQYDNLGRDSSGSTRRTHRTIHPACTLCTIHIRHDAWNSSCAPVAKCDRR